MHGISHNFRLKANLYYGTNLAKFIVPAVIKKGSHTIKVLASTLEVRKNNWRNEFGVTMMHSFSRSPVYQSAAVLSAKIIASVKK